MSSPTPQLLLPLAGDLQALPAQTEVHVQGPHRFVSINGKTGWQPLSRQSALRLPTEQHLQDHASFVLWICPTETLAVSPPLQHTHDKHPNWQEYGLLADTLSTNDIAESVFTWYWRSYWHPQMVAKFMRGPAGGAAADFAVTPYVPVEHMTLLERRWYQLVLTVDKPASRLCIYLNGVLCGTTRYPFRCQPPRRELYLGNTAMAFADVAVFDHALTQEQITALFQAGDAPRDAQVDESLRQLYTVQPKPAVDWAPDAQWTLKLDRSLTRDGDFDGWAQQGCSAPPFEMPEKRITPEGLLLQTPARVAVESRVYFWSPEVYEGDMAVEFEFRPEQDTGLALLVLQAAGMQGEDFWTDHPPRSTGSMNTIIGDQVKNYHWEFFRHAVDVRNDLGTHVLAKNPWCKALGMSTTPSVALNEWHRLVFVQEGSRLRCALDGDWVLDVQDDAHSHCGPVLHGGRVGLRQMYDTRIRYRNLRIWNRNPITVISTHRGPNDV